MYKYKWIDINYTTINYCITIMIKIEWTNYANQWQQTVTFVKIFKLILKSNTNI